MGKKSIILDIDVKDGKIGTEALTKAIDDLRALLLTPNLR